MHLCGSRLGAETGSVRIALHPSTAAAGQPIADNRDCPRPDAERLRASAWFTTSGAAVLEITPATVGTGKLEPYATPGDRTYISHSVDGGRSPYLSTYGPTCEQWRVQNPAWMMPGRIIVRFRVALRHLIIGEFDSTTARCRTSPAGQAGSVRKALRLPRSTRPRLHVRRSHRGRR